MTRSFPFLAAVCLILSFVASSFAAGPPCLPCVGVVVDDPLALVPGLEAEPRLEGEQRFYAAWRVALDERTVAQAESAARLEAAGARPWMQLVFTASAPLADDLDRLEREVEAAVALAEAVGERPHFQVLWEPANGAATAADRAFLLKRVSVALVGAAADALVLFGPLPAEEPLLRELYAEDLGAYLDGVVLRPAPLPELAAAAELLAELDPGRPLVVDGAVTGEPASRALARAAEHASNGLTLTLFDGTEALAPLKVMAREMSGEIAFDPYSEPQGNARAWSFVRAEDLALRIVAEVPETTERLELTLGEAALQAPQSLDLATGVAEPIIARRGQRDFTLQIASPEPVELLAVARPALSEREGAFEERLEIAGERQMPVAEILRRLQAFDDAQARRLQTYQAVQTEFLRFSVPSGPEIEVTREGDFFFERDQGFDWAWQRVYVGGVEWKGRFPQFPIIQPEKASAQPLEITLRSQYDYRLRGTDVIDGRDCWVVEFRPRADDEAESLWRGTVWIDRELYARVRLRANQVGLSGDVLSNEQTLYYEPLNLAGQSAEWGRETVVLPTRRVGNELQKIVDATILVEKEQRLERLRFNDPGFEASREAVWASEATMVRDTEEGLRYLERGDDGQRVVQEDFDFSAWALLGGTYYDDSLDYPLPLAGVNYLDRDLFGTGASANLFFAGAILDGLVADPELFGSRFSGSFEVFGLFFPFEQQQYRGGEEIVAEAVEQQRAFAEVQVGRHLSPGLQLDLAYRFAVERYSEADDTDPTFVLPSDTSVHGPRARLRYSRRGYQLGLTASMDQRSDWEPWGDLDQSEWRPEHEEFFKWQLRLSKTFRLQRFMDFGIELEHLDGEHLDRFSKYDFGTFGDATVAGYQNGLITASEAQALHLEYGLSVAEAIRFEVQGDAVWATDPDTGLDRELLGGVSLSGNTVGPWQTLLRFSVGVPVAGPGDGVTAQIFFLKIFK